MSDERPTLDLADGSPPDPPRHSRVLPSRFQLGDRVRGHGVPGIVTAITFTEGKVFYDVSLSEGQTMYRVPSDNMSPAPVHLKTVS